MVDDLGDFEPFRLPATYQPPTVPTKNRLPSRQRLAGKFLRGPIPWDWLCRAMTLGRVPLALGLVLWQLAGMCRQQTVHLTPGSWKGIADRKAIYRALARLEKAGLVHVERSAGRGPTVTIRNLPAESDASSSANHLIEGG